MSHKFLNDFHFEKALKETGLKFYEGEIKSRGSYKYQTMCRYLLAKNLHDKGYSYNQIAKKMNKHHTSIMDLIKKWGPKHVGNKDSKPI